MRKGHEATVYCRGERSKLSTYKGVELIYTPHSSNKFLDFPLQALRSTFDALPRQFDILHYFGTDSSIFTIIPRALSRKVVISLDGLTWNRSSYPRWVRIALRFSSWLPLYLPNATIVDSLYVKEWYRRTYGKAPVYINYGAKISSRGADHTVLHKFGVEENRYILSVGRLVPEKGIHHLISAFNDLETRSKYALVIVGRNPYESTYESSLRRLAKDNVKFLGYVYGSDMENLFKGAYLYVSASELEGTSLALLSAMGFGNCVLVSDIPENLETIGDAGVSFRNRDPRDLHEKMLPLLSNPEIVSNYRWKAIERVARFYSWDSAADRTEQLYLSLIADS